MMMYYYLIIAGAHGRHGKRNSLSLAPAHDHPSAMCAQTTLEARLGQPQSATLLDEQT